MMRLSATQIENFRLYSASEWFGYEDMIASLERKTIATEDMRRGSAIHALYEYQRELQSMPSLVSADLAALFDGMPLGASEIKSTAVRNVDGTDVTIVCVADRQHGLHLYDHKVTHKAIDADKYDQSMQWRVNLDIFGCDRFVYNVIRLGGTGPYAVADRSMFTFDRYDGMSDDIDRALSGLVSFIKAEGMTDAVTPDELPDAAYVKVG